MNEMADTTPPGDGGGQAITALVGGSGAAWVSVSDEQEPAERNALTRFLSDLLQSPSLMILAGLGTSLCIPGAPTMADLWREVAGLDRYAAVLEETKWSAENDGDVELLLSRCDMVSAINPASVCTMFKAAAEGIIFNRCRFVTSSTSLSVHQDFLRRVARRSSRLARSRVFTTNYDIAFEAAAASLGYLIVDGFSYASPRTFDPAYFDYDFVKHGPGRQPELVSEVFVLHKLHGSVNWDARRPRIVQVDAPESPVLIFPRQSKYELAFELPFLESMSRYQATLRQQNVGLLVLGSGLHDKHLIEPILACLRANASARVAVVDPSARTSEGAGHVAMRTVAERGDPRIALIDSTFESFVSLLPDLAPVSEAERQERAVRELLTDELAKVDAVET